MRKISVFVFTGLFSAASAGSLMAQQQQLSPELEKNYPGYAAYLRSKQSEAIPDRPSNSPPSTAPAPTDTDRRYGAAAAAIGAVLLGSALLGKTSDGSKCPGNTRYVGPHNEAALNQWGGEPCPRGSFLGYGEIGRGCYEWCE